MANTITNNRAYGNNELTWENLAGAMQLGEEASRFRPMPGKILVFPDPVKVKTDGGIFIPETSIKRAQTGTIAALGDGCNGALHVGQTVYVSYWAAWSIELDGQDYRLYLEKDLGGYLAPPA